MPPTDSPSRLVLRNELHRACVPSRLAASLRPGAPDGRLRRPPALLHGPVGVAAHGAADDGFLRDRRAGLGHPWHRDGPDGARPGPAGRPPRPAGRAADAGLRLPLLLTTLIALVLGGAPAWGVIAGSFATGASTPLVSGTVRALWSKVDPRIRPTAFALDATTTELVFVVGPTLVAALTVLATPAVAVAVAGVLATAGAVAIAMSGAMRRWTP